MGSTFSTGFVLPVVQEADLKGPDLNRLNRILQLLAQQVGAIQGANGRSVFDELQANLLFGENTDVPTDPTAILTLAAAKKLFATPTKSSGSGGGTPGPPGPAGPAGASGGSAIVEDHVLASGGTTTITPASPSAIGNLLTVFVQAKGFTGILAWGTNTRWAPTELDTTNDTWTPFNFIARTDPNDSVIRWFWVGPGPVGGQPT